MKCSLIIAFVAWSFPGALLSAEEAVVTKIEGQASRVEGGQAVPLKLGDRVPSGAGVQTGDQTKLELTNSRGKVRFGSKSYIPTTDPKEIDLAKGLLVMSCEPGRFRRSMKVKTPEHELKVTGTIQTEYLRDAFLMVTCVEGYVDVNMGSFFGDKIRLIAGQTILLSPTERRLPDPVVVDLQRLYETSALLEGTFGPLPAANVIVQSIADQREEMQSGELESTPLSFPRGGTLVEYTRSPESSATEVQTHQPDLRKPPIQIGSQELHVTVHDAREALEESNEPQKLRVQTEQGGKVNDYGEMTLNRGDLQLKDFVQPGDAMLRLSSDDFGAHITLSIDLQDPDTEEIATLNYDILGGEIPVELTFAESPDRLNDGIGLSSSGLLQVVGATLVGRSIAFSQLGGATDSLLVADAHLEAEEAIVFHSLENDVRLLGDFREATFEANANIIDVEADNGRAALNKTALDGASGITINGNQGVEIVGGTLMSTRGDIHIDANGLDLVVRDSSELKALAENIQLLSQGGKITLDAADLRAAREILIDRPGGLEISVSNINAETIRARAFGDGATLLVDNSVLNAATLLRLYAEGASTLEFRGTVNLTAPQVDLAGNIVRVQNGGVVVIDGQGSVYANLHEYNREGFGGITETRDQIEQLPFPLRPSFD